MNSGALAELIHQCPYRFNGIDIIANIFFVIALITYVMFSIMFTARFLWFKRAAYLEIVNDINEITFVSCKIPKGGRVPFNLRPARDPCLRPMLTLAPFEI